MISSYINGRKITYEKDQWVEVPLEKNFENILNKLGLNEFREFSNKLIANNGHRYRFNFKQHITLYNSLEVSYYMESSNEYSDWKTLEPSEAYIVLVDVMSNNFHFIVR